MFRISCPVLAISLLISGLSLHAAVGAQTPVPGLVPNVDLNASLPSGPEHAESLQFDTRSGVTQVQLNKKSDTAAGKLFNESPPPDGGWKGLARLLEALTPSVDTSIPLSASQITARISSMLNEGKNQAALDVIEKRTAQLQRQQTIGTDVQLMFLHGRALAALDRHNEAIELYLKMTTLYPELPEPWNNLAAEYVKQGKLDMAHDALRMALTADPRYATAQTNMGEVQLMLAQQSFHEAAQLGGGQARSRADQALEALQK